MTEIEYYRLKKTIDRLMIDIQEMQYTLQMTSECCAQIIVIMRDIRSNSSYPRSHLKVVR